MASYRPGGARPAPADALDALLGDYFLVLMDRPVPTGLVELVDRLQTGLPAGETVDA